MLLLGPRAAVTHDKDVRTVQKNYTRAAEAILQSSSLLWNMTLQRVVSMIEHQGFEGLIFMRKRRYDESPFKLRLREETKCEAGASEAPGNAKVMQSELGFACLLRRPKPGIQDEFECQEVHGWAPTALHVLDKTTTQNIAQSQRNIQKAVALPDNVERNFKLLCDMVCTDGYSSNVAAEVALASENPDWTKSYNFCLLHKAAAVQSAQFRMVPGHVSGLLSVSLSMQASGTTSLLKDLLSKILRDKLRLKHGVPPPSFRAHQEAVHDLFLPVGPHVNASLLHNRQRMVLFECCNGNLQDEEVVAFWSSDPDAKLTEELTDVWVRRVVAALLPHKCPYFNRSKWVGGELAIEWAGLLCSYNNLLQPLVQAWVAATTSDVPSAAVASNMQRPPQAEPVLGWSAVADRVRDVDSEAAQGPSELDAGHVPTVEAEIRAPQDENPDISWAEFNKANKRKALAYVATSPGAVLVLMRLCMRAALRVIYTLVRFASVTFTQEQLTKSARGEARTHRVLEFFSGKVQEAFRREISDVMSSDLLGLPAKNCTEAMRALAFRMLSVGCCAAQQLIWRLATSSVVVLFRSLQDGAAAIKDMVPCLHDQLTRAILSMFPTQALLESDMCRQMLHALAEHYQLDILDLERNHSTIRRTILSKSLQTWAATFSSACAHWIVRRISLLRRFFCAEPKRKKTRQKKAKKQTQGGGPWRAFLHLNAKSEGRQWGGAFMRRMAARYHAAKTTPGFQLFRNLGVLGHMASRAGQSSFARPQRRRDRANPVQADVVLPIDAADALDGRIQASLTELARQSRADALRRTAAAQAEQEVVAATSAALAPGHTRGLAKPDAVSGQLGSAFVFTPGTPSVAEFCVPADRFCKDDL